MNGGTPTTYCYDHAALAQGTAPAQRDALAAAFDPAAMATRIAALRQRRAGV